MSFKSLFGALKDARGDCKGFGILILTCIWSLFFGASMCQILALYLVLILKVQRTCMSLKSLFGALEDAGGSWQGLASLSWFGYGQWALIYPWSKFGLSILIFKVQRTSISFKPSFGALEDTGGSWLGFGISILIWIWSLVFVPSIFRIFAQLQLRNSSE